MTVDMKKLEALLDRQPHIPAGKRRDIEVVVRTLPAGSKVPIVSIRNAILMGQKHTTGILDEPYRMASLEYKGGVWMTNAVQEIWQMREPLEKVRGRVLVGGLGLGIFTQLAVGQPDVESVTTIEKSPDIIRLVAAHLDERVRANVVQADLFEYLKAMKRREYNSAFFDIWQGTGEFSWTDYVVPLRRLCRGKIAQSSIHCWNEDEMIGQLRGPFGALPRVAVMALTDKMPWYYWVFRKAAINEGVLPRGGLKPDNSKPFVELMEAAANAGDDLRIAEFITFYTTKPGTDRWERVFGRLWDEARERYESEVANAE